MTDEEQNTAKECFWYLFYGAILYFIVANAPEDKNNRLYNAYSIATIILCGVSIGHFYIRKLFNPKEEKSKSTVNYTAPPAAIKKMPYIFPYKSHCYNCKQSIHSSYNTYCDKCEHFKCNGCGSCFCTE